MFLINTLYLYTNTTFKNHTLKQRINVTKTFLPEYDEYTSILKRAWDNTWLTNRGALVLELEKNIETRFKTGKMIAMTNGTLPLQIAIKGLALKGEIITTPFSYVATTSSIVWEDCKPVFVDISPDYLTIDEVEIEKQITSKTSAILVTHVFGNPCHIENIEAIAKKHKLKVIYDAAHCFGVNYNGKSIFNYGDVSTCSFHATKIFHSGEGGALFTTNESLYHKLYYHHNFGHDGQESFFGVGINAKMSELQAALGLAVLPHFDAILKLRKQLYTLYLSKLIGYDCFAFQKIRANTDYNYAYFPVIFNSEEDLLRVVKALNDKNVFPRRYFYPSLETLPYVYSTAQVPISQSISKRILCLPLYYDLNASEVNSICEIITDELC